MRVVNKAQTGQFAFVPFCPRSESIVPARKVAEYDPVHSTEITFKNHDGERVMIRLYK